MADEGHEYGLSRRGFVAGVVALIGGLISAVIGLPAIGYLIAPALKRSQADEWVPLGTVEDLPEGVPTLFTFTRTRQVGWERNATSYGMYAIKHGEGEYTVFSNVCTHLSCRVTWQEDRDIFFCPCHDGRFGKDGEVLAGPPPRPLDEFEYRVQEGTLEIHLVEA